MRSILPLSARTLRWAYWLDQGQETIETCPLTGTDLSEPKNKTEVAPLLALTEMLARRREFITCEEEERSGRVLKPKPTSRSTVGTNLRCAVLR